MVNDVEEGRIGKQGAILGTETLGERTVKAGEETYLSGGMSKQDLVLLET